MNVPKCYLRSTLACITHATLEETGWMFNNPTSSSWHNNHISQPLSDQESYVNWFWPQQTWPPALLQSLCPFAGSSPLISWIKMVQEELSGGGSRGWETPRREEAQVPQLHKLERLTRNASNGLDHENKRNLRPCQSVRPAWLAGAEARTS